MMRTMREMSKYVFYVLAVAFLGWLVFDVGAGITGRSTGATGDVVLKVNGQEVHYPQWQQAYQSAYDQARRQSSGQLTKEDEQELQDRVADQMIQTVLLHQAYDKLGITVSDDEIRQAALTSPPPEVTGLAEFQVNGRFDMEKWQQFVTRGSNPEFLFALEQRYRDEIPYVKFLQFLTADVYVPDAHLWRMYRDAHDSVTVAVVAVTPEQIPDSAAPVTEAEARRYFAQHQNEFKRPAIAYLSFVAQPRLPEAGDTAAAPTQGAGSSEPEPGSCSGSCSGGVERGRHRADPAWLAGGDGAREEAQDHRSRDVDLGGTGAVRRRRGRPAVPAHPPVPPGQGLGARLRLPLAAGRVHFRDIRDPPGDSLCARSE